MYYMYIMGLLIEYRKPPQEKKVALLLQKHQWVPNMLITDTNYFIILMITFSTKILNVKIGKHQVVKYVLDMLNLLCRRLGVQSK